MAQLMTARHAANKAFPTASPFHCVVAASGIRPRATALTSDSDYVFYPHRGPSTAKVPEGAAVQEINLDRNAETGDGLIRGIPAASSLEPKLKHR